MPFLFEYILKLSVSFGVVYLFYQLVLRKLTFYNWNRGYLLVYTLISFLVPLIDISSLLETGNINDNSIIYAIPCFDNIPLSSTTFPSSSNSTGALLNGWSISMIIILAGAGLLFGRLTAQLISYRKVSKKGTLIMKEGIKIYQVDMPVIPFSFGGSIFINQGLHTAEELKEIIRHEFVHVKQKHTVDILWGELLCIVNWYNPFVWLIRQAIRQNLEFIADSKVLESGIDKKNYQYLLLKVIGNNHFSIASQFNFSSLKKRIAMMNKMQSAKKHLVRFLFILPVAAVMLLAFRQQQPATDKAPVILSQIPDTPPPGEKRLLPEDIKNIEITDSKAIITHRDGAIEKYDLTNKEGREAFDKKYGELIPPPPPVPPVPPIPPVSRLLPKIVETIEVADNIVIVKLKDGKAEKFDLDDEKEKAAFEKKYGEVLPPPPPLPQVGAIPAAPSVSFVSPIQPVPPVPPVPPVKASLPDNVTSLEINNGKAVIKLKDGKIENYDLNDKKEKVEFEKKYGEIEGPQPPLTPVKRLSTTTLSGTITGDIATTIASPAKTSSGPITFIAETVNWNGKERTLHLKGDAIINDVGSKVTVSGDIIDLKQPGSFPVIINGQEAEWDKDYINNGRREFIINMLNKEDAIKKYGNKGKDGVLEVNSIVL